MNNEVLHIGERLSQRNQDFLFAMQHNGYLLKKGKLEFNHDSVRPLIEEFTGQQVSFFGPNQTDQFYSGVDTGSPLLIAALTQQQVTDVIRKYRDIDENQAARIAFIFGGTVRHLVFGSPFPLDKIEATEVSHAVEFAARMTILGEPRSGDAIASAMAMYIISDGSLEKDNHFMEQVYRMAEAISDDPIDPWETKDLGISQVARLRAFEDKTLHAENGPFPNLGRYEGAFDGFPTVGAEFHFPPDAIKKIPKLWQRLALLNMSQYQRGSYVQLSRNDRNVIEVRMNPSIYPVTIANWQHMKLLLPELNEAFFTVTLNRNSAEGNFYWKHKEDKNLLSVLRGMGMLSYAGLFKDIPQRNSPEEIDFGQVYLGQTVKLDDGEYDFSGLWGRGEGDSGQFGIYAGYGKNLPELAYYLSMSLVKPSILNSVLAGKLSEIKSLSAALDVDPSVGKSIFEMVRHQIQRNNKLQQAHHTGLEIMELLSP